MARVRCWGDCVAKLFLDQTNFPGCGRGDRIIVPSDDPTGNFGSALEDILISDFRLVSLFAETLQAIFGVCNTIGGKPDLGRTRREV